MFIMSKFTQKSDSKVFGLGSTLPLPPAPWQMSKSKPKKVPQTIWIPVGPTPLRQCPNMSRFLFRLASLTYNTQYITITLIPSFQVPKVVTDLNRKVVEGLVEGSD